MSDEYHALASPSRAHRDLYCANSLAMEIGQPDSESKAASFGTDKHELLALCMEFGKNAMDYEGHVLRKGHTVNRELATDVQTVLGSVRERIWGYRVQGADVSVEIEQDVPIEHITGEVDATGRVDVVLLISWPDGAMDVDVIDAKFGYQEVDPENNPQLMEYASGTLEKFAVLGAFRTVNLVIEQPLRGAIPDFETTPAAISQWVKWASPRIAKAIMIHRMAGERALKEEDFAPSEKVCQWCKAYAVCPAARAKVEEAIEATFEVGSKLADVQALPVEELGPKFEMLEMIEDWIKAVRARIELEVFAGNKVSGVKVVAGKRGNRQWSSEEEAEALMKKFKMKQEQIYSFKLLGPKPILDALKDQPRRLKQIEQLVVQSDGKPHVVSESDKRPAIKIKPVEDGFETVKDDLC